MPAARAEDSTGVQARSRGGLSVGLSWSRFLREGARTGGRCKCEAPGAKPGPSMPLFQRPDGGPEARSKVASAAWRGATHSDATFPTHDKHRTLPLKLRIRQNKGGNGRCIFGGWYHAPFRPSLAPGISRDKTKTQSDGQRPGARLGADVACHHRAAPRTSLYLETTSIQSLFTASGPAGMMKGWPVAKDRSRKS